MSRISQDLAGQIAQKLTNKSRQAAELLRKEFENLVLAEYQKQTPDEVKETYEAYPDWFCTNNTVKLHGHGFNWEWVHVSEPVIANNHKECFLKLTNPIADRLSKAKTKWEKAEKACKDLKRETEQALINLRTYKNIRESIPEAIPFLPPPITNTICVNVNSLNKKLAQQPDVKKEEKVVS